ncbi:MAG TPA: hypothetical protein VL728_01525 [Cyclobacteriaceae bacterium]|nr:hypothetical protein [Cyclobacteriaceae bacterium]
MKRRTFIISTAAGIGAISAAYYFFGDVDYDPALAEPQALSYIWDDKTIKDAGRRYRKDFPSEASERTLVKLLKTVPTEETITADFKNGNMVVVDGWILSVTEARQCALASQQE